MAASWVGRDFRGPECRVLAWITTQHGARALAVTGEVCQDTAHVTTERDH